MPVAQVRNVDHTLLSMVDLLPISDRNIAYKRGGLPGVTSSITSTGVNVAVPMPVLVLTVSFNELFSWDGTNHRLTILDNGLYWFVWKVTFRVEAGGGSGSYTSFLQQSIDGGANFFTIGTSTTPVSITAPAGSPAYATSTGFEMWRVLKNFQYRLRAERIDGSANATIYTEFSSLMVLRLIGTPSST